MQAFRMAMLATAISVLSAAPSAWAASLVFTDTAGASGCLSASAPAACNSGGASTASRSFTHDILDSGFLATDVITGAQLVLTLTDDGGPRDANEKLSLLVDLVTVVSNADANHDKTITLDTLGALSDGLLAIVIGALDGDFLFGGSTLTVWVERADPPAPPLEDIVVNDQLPVIEVAAVPGPSPLLALGLGLLLTGGVLRRRRRLP